jgi:DNA topoisomerase-1
MAVSDLLVANFPDIMDPKFTAHLEGDLDRIAEGEVSWVEIMREFYGPFDQELQQAKTKMPRIPGVPSGISCPKCQKELLIRWGRAGEFLGCSAYPDCDFTSDIQRDAQGDIVSPAKEQTGAAAQGGKPGATGLSCPECGKDLVVRRGPKGEFLGCSGYPRCRFTQNLSWSADGKPIPAEAGETSSGPPCPQEGCTGHLVKRRSRRGFFYGCSRYPNCSFTLNHPPVETPCPQCQFPWLRKKGKKLLCPKDNCDYEEPAPANAAVSG